LGNKVRKQNPNIEILELAVKQLGSLIDEMVFLGGCATGLLITDSAAPPIRMTNDVDTIVQVSSLSEYHQLSEKLRNRGFKEDVSDGAPLCRWINESVVLDVMPTDSKILGFGNCWYESAIKNADIVTLLSAQKIKLVSAPYFLITKLEAFDGRGNGDYQLSHDMEDIVAVLDGRPELPEEIGRIDSTMASELAMRFAQLLKTEQFINALPGHLPGDQASQARIPIIINRIQKIAEVRG